MWLRTYWPCYGRVLSKFSSTDPDNVIDDRSDDEDDFGVDVEGDDTDIDLGPDGMYTWFFWYEDPWLIYRVIAHII